MSTPLPALSLLETRVLGVLVEKLDVPADSAGALVGFMINANRIGKASFTGMYGRK